MMSYVDPQIKSNFDSLAPELQEAIMKRDVQLHTMNDLMQVLEKIVEEG